MVYWLVLVFVNDLIVMYQYCVYWYFVFFSGVFCQCQGMMYLVFIIEFEVRYSGYFSRKSGVYYIWVLLIIYYYFSC